MKVQSQKQYNETTKKYQENFSLLEADPSTQSPLQKKDFGHTEKETDFNFVGPCHFCLISLLCPLIFFLGE